MRSWTSPNWRERTAAIPDSPGCSDEGSVDQSVMLDGKSMSFTFSIVAKPEARFNRLPLLGCVVLFAMLPEKLAVEIRREFFQDIGSHVDANLSPKLCHGIAHVAVVLIVCVGNRDCGGVSENLGIIEVHAA